MPWKETDPMIERTQFIAADLSQVYSMTELCERFGIPVPREYVRFR